MSRLHVVPTAESASEATTDFKSRRDSQFSSPAVVRDVGWYSGQPYQRISVAALDRLSQLLEAPKPHKSNRQVVIRLLDIFLQITNQSLKLRDGRLSPKSVVLDFCGAIYSEKFLWATPSRRFDLVCVVRFIADETGTIEASAFPSTSTLGITAEWKKKKEKFEQTDLDEEAVKSARGWPVTTPGGIRWLDLRALEQRFGEAYATGFQRATQGFYDSRNQESIHQVAFLIDYLATLPPEWAYDDFARPEKIQELVALYALHFAETRGQTHHYAYVQSHWTKGRNFIIKALLKSGFWATPSWELPIFPITVVQHHTHRREDGTGVGRYSAKLLTDVPLKLTDKEAAEILFSRIQSDLAIVKKWANAQILDLWERHETFLALSKVGVVRELSKPGYVLGKGQTRRSHSKWRENIAATFLARGFETAEDEPRLDLLYGSPATDVYSLLALPTAGTLLPHMAILVSEHPLITPSFFEELVLFDAHDHVVGVSEIDTTWVIDGRKARKGPRNAQQTFALTDRAAEVLAQVIALTEPLRKYLRKKGDGNWRRIFLECQRGFVYPTPVAASKRTSGNDNVERLTKEFAPHAALSESEVRRLALRFSLITLRASEAVERYLRKPDLAEAAKNLGHEKLVFSQIERYVPPPLIAFFEERWVRLFQNAVIAEALKGSEYLLRATDFVCIEDLHEFLENHALKVRPIQPEKPEVRNDLEDSRVYFSASVETLAVLEALRRAVELATRKVTTLAMEWADFAERLKKYINFAQPPREELVFLLEQAEACAHEVVIAEEAIYE